MIFSFFLCTMLGQIALADILFIDMNFSEQEVAAARASAKKSKRELVVYPNPTDQEKQKLRKAVNELSISVKARDKCRNNIYNSTSKKEPLNLDACSKLEEIVQDKESAFDAIRNQVGFKKPELEKLLADRAAQNKFFSSVVVSGHDGTGTFSGIFGSIFDGDLATSLATQPKIKDSIRAFHLWGCNTTTLSSIILNWRSRFPNAALLTGFDDKGPLNTTPSGWQYLGGVLDREEKYLEAGDGEKLKRLLRETPGALNLHAAIVACDTSTNLRGHFNLGELQQKCIGAKQAVLKHEDEYLCYQRAVDPKCDDPPADTTGGFLRQFYRVTQDSEACSQALDGIDYDLSKYKRDTVLRLLLFKEVVKNFQRLHKDDLGKIDQALGLIGGPEDLKFADVGTLSRGQIVRRTDNLMGFLISKYGAKFEKLDDKDDTTPETEKRIARNLVAFHSALTGTLFRLETHCVPFDWVEPRANQKSACVGGDRVPLLESKLPTSLEDTATEIPSPPFHSWRGNRREAPIYTSHPGQSEEEEGFPPRRPRHIDEEEEAPPQAFRPDSDAP